MASSAPKTARECAQVQSALDALPEINLTYPLLTVEWLRSLDGGTETERNIKISILVSSHPGRKLAECRCHGCVYNETIPSNNRKNPLYACVVLPFLSKLVGLTKMEKARYSKCFRCLRAGRACSLAEDPPQHGCMHHITLVPPKHTGSRYGVSLEAEDVPHSAENLAEFIASHQRREIQIDPCRSCAARAICCIRLTALLGKNKDLCGFRNKSWSWCSDCIMDRRECSVSSDRPNSTPKTGRTTGLDTVDPRRQNSTASGKFTINLSAIKDDPPIQVILSLPKRQQPAAPPTGTTVFGSNSISAAPLKSLIRGNRPELIQSTGEQRQRSEYQVVNAGAKQAAEAAGGIPGENSTLEGMQRDVDVVLVKQEPGVPLESRGNQETGGAAIRVAEDEGMREGANRQDAGSTVQSEKPNSGDDGDIVVAERERADELEEDQLMDDAVSISKPGDTGSSAKDIQPVVNADISSIQGPDPLSSASNPGNQADPIGPRDTSVPERDGSSPAIASSSKSTTKRSSTETDLPDPKRARISHTSSLRKQEEGSDSEEQEDRSGDEDQLEKAFELVSLLAILKQLRTCIQRVRDFIKSGIDEVYRSELERLEAVGNLVLSKGDSRDWGLFLNHLHHLYDRYEQLTQDVIKKASKVEGTEQKELLRLRQKLYDICNQLILLQAAFEEYQKSEECEEVAGLGEGSVEM